MIKLNIEITGLGSDDLIGDFRLLGAMLQEGAAYLSDREDDMDRAASEELKVAVQEALATNTTLVSEQDAADDAAGKPRRTRRTKAEMEAAKLAEAAQEAPAGEPVQTAAAKEEPLNVPGVSASTPAPATADIVPIAVPSEALSSQARAPVIDADPFAAANPFDEGSAETSDYDTRLISFKATNPGKTSQDFIKAELMRYCDKHGGAQAKEGMMAVSELIGRFGFAQVRAVPEARYPELLSVIDAARAG